MARVDAMPSGLSIGAQVIEALDHDLIHGSHGLGGCEGVVVVPGPQTLASQICDKWVCLKMVSTPKPNG